ncbi:MAG: HEAT repeat domain-containing protein [Promethearchaeota archaeon]
MLIELVQQNLTENVQFLKNIYHHLELLQPSTDFRINLEDSSELKQKGNELFEKLVLGLVHPDPNVRYETIEFFNENFETSHFILLSAGNIIDELPVSIKKKIMDKMLEYYKTGNDSYLRFATFWLGMYGDDSSLPFLIKNLSHPSSKIVKQVINALGIFGSSRAIPYLLPLIHDEEIDSKLKHSAITAIAILGEIGVGIQSLIHELYTRSSTDYSDLIDYLKSHGARILKYLAVEIEYERDSARKKKLNLFFTSISEEFSVMNSKKYNILL